MNLEKMLEAQKALDQRIVKEKGLEGQDLFANTVLALQVELAEFANEGRWFKHWSDDQEPRKGKTVRCNYCRCKGKMIIDENEIACSVCKGKGEVSTRNPLLEEYVDALHFFLSISIQKGWEDALYLHEEAIFELGESGFVGGLTGIYNEVVYSLMKSCIETERDKKLEELFGCTKQEFSFRNAWFCFIAIGLIGFKFTEEQIEEAYFAKNAVNHARQDNGY